MAREHEGLSNRHHNHLHHHRAHCKFLPPYHYYLLLITTALQFTSLIIHPSICSLIFLFYFLCFPFPRRSAAANANESPNYTILRSKCFTIFLLNAFCFVSLVSTRFSFSSNPNSNSYNVFVLLSVTDYRPPLFSLALSSLLLLCLLSC